jgi:hypothetical protein
MLVMRNGQWVEAEEAPVTDEQREFWRLQAENIARQQRADRKKIPESDKKQ